MMHGDSRVMVVVCLATTSLPAPCLSTSTFPGSREEPFLLPAKCLSRPPEGASPAQHRCAWCGHPGRHRHGHGMHQQPARQDTSRVVTQGHVQPGGTVPRVSVREKDTRETTP